MKIKTNIIMLTCFSLLITACSSGYNKFYYPNLAITPANKLLYLKNGEMPEIVYSSDLKKDTLKFWTRGYILIGNSSFNGELENEKKILKQARKVGATLVVVNQSYVNTQSNTVNLNFQGGYAPYTSHQRRFDQNATFLAKSLEKKIYGIWINDLSDENKQAIGSNSGVIVEAVLDDSPAYNANILPKDIIVKINGQKIKNYEEVKGIFSNRESDVTAFTIFRNNKLFDINVNHN